MDKPIIQFKDFSFKYDSQKSPTLNNINLSIYPGEKILIVGPSGSGKSTLAHGLNGLIPSSYKGKFSGEFLINNEEAFSKNIFDRSKMIGTVLQDPDSQFVGLTVGEDIAFSLENDATPKDIMENKVKIYAFKVDMLEKLKSSIHEISGGQKQRAALAGVLVDDVDVLLFDEPLANLDPHTGKLAIELIDRMHEETKKTIVIIEHRIEDVLHRPVDRVIVMNDGKIVMNTSPDKILSSSVLTDVKLREPLYITALKDAGVVIHEDMHASRLDQLFLNDKEKQKVLSWFNNQHDFLEPKQDEVLLELRNLNFSYDGSSMLLKNINLKIYKGEMISLVGKNGAGKSTLAKVITGIEKHSKGNIIMQGRDIGKASIAERASNIGLVMQNPNNMISKVLIYDEVALGLRLRGFSEDEVQKKVYETLKICGLYSYRNWPISALSFGQKKRVTIASILSLKPSILILDEPTAGQDLKHYTDIMNFLKELNKLGITIVLITHDMHLMMEYTQRAVVLTDGKIISDDTPVNILGDEEIIKKANLKQTSLYYLADYVGIKEREKFVARFIHSEEVKRDVN